MLGWLAPAAALLGIIADALGLAQSMTARLPRFALRAQRKLRPIRDAVDGYSLAEIPRGRYAFASPTDLQDVSPLDFTTQVSGYRKQHPGYFEVHKLANGEIEVVGYATDLDANTIEQDTSPIEPIRFGLYSKRGRRVPEIVSLPSDSFLVRGFFYNRAGSCLDCLRFPTPESYQGESLRLTTNGGGAELFAKLFDFGGAVEKMVLSKLLDGPAIIHHSPGTLKKVASGYVTILDREVHGSLFGPDRWDYYCELDRNVVDVAKRKVEEWKRSPEGHAVHNLTKDQMDFLEILTGPVEHFPKDLADPETMMENRLYQAALELREIGFVSINSWGSEDMIQLNSSVAGALEELFETRFGSHHLTLNRRYIRGHKDSTGAEE